LTNTFAVDKFKIFQWDAFVRKNRPDIKEKSLADIIDFLRSFLMPPVSALARKKDFYSTWLPGGPWQ
jgi:hypothetical protein